MGLLSLTLLGCFISTLTVPRTVVVNDISLQLYPAQKLNICHSRNSTQNIRFVFYYNGTPRKLRIGSLKSLQESGLNVKIPTTIYIHGFLGHINSNSTQRIRKAYLQRKNVNFVVVDAQTLFAGPWYLSAAYNTQSVGKEVAAFINFLVKHGARMNKIHVIGHSIGAHAAGIAGGYVKYGRIGRITGLDPAAPLFMDFPKSNKLDQSDASFVDVIHSDAGGFGSTQLSGHADFFPNGGRAPQPGCKINKKIERSQSLNPLNTVFCSHSRAVKYYAESVLQEDKFTAFSCPSASVFREGHCYNNKVVYMGLKTPTTTRGQADNVTVMRDIVIKLNVVLIFCDNDYTSGLQTIYKPPEYPYLTVLSGKE